jgi:hypothetical protein
MRYNDWDMFLWSDTDQLIHRMNEEDEIATMIAASQPRPTIELNEERRE